MSYDLEKEHLDLLIQASSMLNSSLDLDRVLGQLLRQATVLVGADSGYILEKDGDSWTVKIAIHAGRESAVEKANYSTTIVEKAFDSLSTICLLDAVSDPMCSNSTSIQTSGIRSVLCTPLLWKQRIRGVIYLENRRVTGVFRKSQVALIEALSQQAATALENASLYQEREGFYEKALSDAQSELAFTQTQLLI